MQGPSQRPGRRAGDSSGMPGAPENGIKDWQKNTWFGPAPANSNPFEEPDNAPELLDERSSNLTDRSQDFWNEQQPTGYQYAAGELKKQDAHVRKRGKKRGLPAKAAGIFVAVIAAVSLILYFGVFRIREIRVIGNSDLSAEDVIRFSGIRRGESILGLSEEKTEKQLNAAAAKAADDTGNYNYLRLQFRYLEKELPGTVTIAVREREACCWTVWCGILYVMDKNGMVLFESEDEEMREKVQLVEVKGLDIRSGAQTGQTIVLASAAQEQVFRDLFMEMKVLNCTDRILEADLSNLSSVLLTTRDPHFTVSLGSSESLHAKIRSMLLVQDKLKEMGKSGGSINVSNPATPSYSPSSPQ